MAKKQATVETATTAIVEIPVGPEPIGYPLQFVGVNLTPRQSRVLRIVTEASSDNGTKVRTRNGERYIENYDCRAVAMILDLIGDQINLPY